MPLQNYQYDTIMREYNRRQARNRRIQEEHLAEAYEKIPRLREIDEEVATLSARKARALIAARKSALKIFALILPCFPRNALHYCFLPAILLIIWR